MDHPVDEAEQGADAKDDGDGENAEVVAVGAVQHEHREDDGAEREDALDREVDRAHEDDEGRAEAEHQRDHRRLAHAHEIAEGEEVRVDQRDDQAEEDEHDHRRP